MKISKLEVISAVSLVISKAFVILAKTIAILMLWGWYFVPMGLTPIGILESFGLCMIVEILGGTEVPTGKTKQQIFEYLAKRTLVDLFQTITFFTLGGIGSLFL